MVAWAAWAAWTCNCVTCRATQPPGRSDGTEGNRMVPLRNLPSWWLLSQHCKSLVREAFVFGICNSAVALLPSHRPTLPPGAENEQRETARWNEEQGPACGMRPWKRAEGPRLIPYAGRLRVASKALHQALLRGPVSLRNLGNLVASGSDQEQRETRSVSLRNLPSGERRDAKTRFGGSLLFWRSCEGRVRGVFVLVGLSA